MAVVAERRLAVIDPGDDDVLRALQRRTVEADVGGHAALADPDAVGLRVLVVAIGADRHPADARRDLVAVATLRRVEPAQERPGAVELAAEPGRLVDEHAVVRHAAEHHGRDQRPAAAVGDVVADRIAAARVADQHDLAGARGRQRLAHRRGEPGHRLRCRRSAGLLAAVVVAGERVGDLDRAHPVARPAVRFEAPERRRPEGGGVAVAGHEHDRRIRRHRPGHGIRSRRARGAASGERQRAGCGRGEDQTAARHRAGWA